jgi:hypothetical protein
MFASLLVSECAKKIADTLASLCHRRSSGNGLCSKFDHIMSLYTTRLHVTAANYSGIYVIEYVLAKVQCMSRRVNMKQA